jgi:hypothetical protein
MKSKARIGTAGTCRKIAQDTGALRMFINETAFFIGAGASWHYGYPTGEKLVRLVAEQARVAENPG